MQFTTIERLFLMVVFFFLGKVAKVTGAVILG